MICWWMNVNGKTLLRSQPEWLATGFMRITSISCLVALQIGRHADHKHIGTSSHSVLDDEIYALLRQLEGHFLLLMSV
jgi:hypothetical protein